MLSPEPQHPIFGAEPGAVDTPEWVADAVFYQIFPDRFAKSDSVQKPSGIESWESDPTTYGYKGGDLIGIVEHLDHLIDLGATAIYLNPIFQSASNHRYHTHDYFTVDPLLGGNEAFDTFLSACKERGLRVILDGVFNHASRGFFYFNDVLENGDASPWRDWFFIGDEFPVNAYDHDRAPGYEAWVGLHALPKLNTDNPQMREYLMRVGEHWMRKGIDGWRLDVPDEIRTPGFWEEFRQRIRAINPQAYIVGEIWHVTPEYLAGDRFDAVMNYVFTSAVLAFTGQDHIVAELQEDRGYDPWPPIDGHEYAARIEALLGSYDWNVQRAQMNLLDSHDTARAITLAGGNMRTLELATLLLFTFPGAPTVYYGDEIGLDGGLPDKWARKTFPWNDDARWRRDLLDHYRGLITLRRELAVLRRGSYQTLAASRQSYAFARRDGDDTAVVALNTSDEPDRLVMQKEGTFEMLIAVGDAPEVEATEVGVAVTLPARSGAVWVKTHA